MEALRHLREVVRNLKHKHTTPKLCPRCGSPELRLSTRFDMWLFPEQYICQQCGYKGPITLELEKEHTETHKAAEPNLATPNPTDASNSCTDS